VIGLLAVFVGGVTGTALRLGLDSLLPHGDAEFPWSTMLINVVGSFALGFLVSRLWPVAPAWLRLALGPGLLGSFTTFSAVMVSMLTLSDAGRMPLALAYLVATLTLGLIAAALGLRWGRRRSKNGTTPGQVSP